MNRVPVITIFLASCLPNRPLPEDSTGSSSESTSSEGVGEVAGHPLETTTEDPDEEGSAEGSGETGSSTSSSSGFAETSTSETTTTSSGSSSSDSTTGSPVESRLIFVSSETRFPDLTLEGFDTFCTDLAGAAGHQGTFKALIMRLDGFSWPEAFKGTYRLPSETIVMAAGGVFGEQELAHSINESEKGTKVPDDNEPVWTGYAMDGPAFTCPCDPEGDPNSCSPWSWFGELELGWVGFVNGNGNDWYDPWHPNDPMAPSGYYPCNKKARVYCYEI